MKEPLISVIVPAYNAERWLEECGLSVLSQTYPHVELVIVDDGSTDATLSVANALAEQAENVKVIHTENGGVCHARNTGLEAASGEFIAFLDADDLLLPRAIEDMYRFMVTFACDIVSASAKTIAENTKLSDLPSIQDAELQYCIWEGTTSLEMSLKDHGGTYAVWGKLYRRSFLKDIRFTEGKRVHEDSYFLFECCLQQPRMLLCNVTAVLYRRTIVSASRAPFSEKFFDILYFAERKQALIEEKYPQYIDLAKNVWVKANMALLQNLCKTRDPKYREAEKKCIREVIANKKYFIPVSRWNRRWFFVITHRMYGVYKFFRR